MSTQSVSYLAAIDASFQHAVKDNRRLWLDGRQLHPDLPQRVIPAEQLRAILLHPSMSHQARDVVMAEVVRLAVAHEQWKTVLVGLLIPGLKRAGGRLTWNLPRDIGDDVGAELVVGVFEGLAAGVGKTHIAARLLTYAIRRARRFIKAWRRNERTKEALDVSSVETGNPEVVIELAYLEGIVSGYEANLIAATRVQGQSIQAIADETGIAEGTLRKRRNRAERKLRLSLGLHDGELEGAEIHA